MPLSTNPPGDVTLGAADRALAVAAVKARLRVALDDEDALIAAFAETALGLAEQFTGQALIAREMALELPVYCGWQRLAGTPVRAIETIETLASDGTPSLLPLIDYAVDIDACGNGWVRIADAGGAGRVRVTMIAGLADGWNTVPAAIREGVAMLAAYLYAARDVSQPPPAAITALWRPYRQIALAPAGHV
jgi:uncharacterized phiE125 gp8 family phage protein